MLPEHYRDRYQKFQQTLEQLQRIIALDQDFNSLRQSFAQIQQIFQGEIASLSGDDLNSSSASRLQSYLTEIDKQLRLLAIDMTFLQAALKPATAQTRLAQISSRLHTLNGYCQAILEKSRE